MELGRLRAAKGDFAGAIQLLDEAANRFPEWSQIDSVRYELADAFRQDARGILKTLAEAMPDAKRQALIQARQERLRRGAELFDLSRKALEARDPRRLSKLEQLQLRNSYFYIADCEFELKDFENAIRHYDAAREKYSADPASLVAMVQIVNAYVEQGDNTRAATAQERAKRFYESLPLSVWSDPNLPMSQNDWRKWLDSMNALKPMVNEGGRQ
jgi:tetratricopeptide (TPR) repeat protein